MGRVWDWLRQTVTASELVLFAVCLLVAGWLLWWQNNRLGADAVATLVGALFGAAILLLGNWINRQNEAAHRRKALQDKRRALNAMIAPELVNVAAGMLEVSNVIEAAAEHVRGGGRVNGSAFTRNTLRDMPLTVSLGAELLNLSSPALDALVTLQANLATARFELTQLADEEIGMLRVAQVVKMHGHNIVLHGSER